MLQKSLKCFVLGSVDKCSIVPELSHRRKTDWYHRVFPIQNAPAGVCQLIMLSNILQRNEIYVGLDEQNMKIECLRWLLISFRDSILPHWVFFTP